MPMLIVYDSLTGNVQRFIDRLNLKNIKISKDVIILEPFVLITYTTGFGEVPKSVTQFLLNNHSFLRAVAVSGNKNWGYRFAQAGDKISQQYQVPLIHKFEIAGNERDVKYVLERIKQL